MAGGAAGGVAGRGRGEGIVARHLVLAWGVPPFELDAESVILRLQLVDGLVRFTLNVVSDVAHMDDLVISRAEAATCILKVHADNVELAAQGRGGVQLRVILTLELVMLALQRLELLVQAEILSDKITADDVAMLVLSLDKGGFIVHSGLRVMSLPR